MKGGWGGNKGQGREKQNQELNKPNIFLYSTFYSSKEIGSNPREIQHYSA